MLRRSRSSTRFALPCVSGGVSASASVSVSVSASVSVSVFVVSVPVPVSVLVLVSSSLSLRLCLCVFLYRCLCPCLCPCACLCACLCLSLSAASPLLSLPLPLPLPLSLPLSLSVSASTYQPHTLPKSYPPSSVSALPTSPPAHAFLLHTHSRTAMLHARKQHLTMRGESKLGMLLFDALAGRVYWHTLITIGPSVDFLHETTR